MGDDLTPFLTLLLTPNLTLTLTLTLLLTLNLTLTLFLTLTLNVTVKGLGRLPRFCPIVLPSPSVLFRAFSQLLSFLPPFPYSPQPQIQLEGMWDAVLANA